MGVDWRKGVLVEVEGGMGKMLKGPQNSTPMRVLTGL